MKEKGLAFLKQMAALWQAFSVAKKVTLGLAVVSVIAAVLAASSYSSRETYAYLFTELGPDDASAIAAKLKELKVPYRVEAGGTAIQVLEDKVYEVRLDLAGQGLPRGGGVGFEIFDKTHLGSTEFEQRINLRRALEGELARTIGTIAAVQNARVHLVLPEHSVFAINKQEASASVVLKLRPARPFAKPEVASVVHLVAAAVPGLSADRVSIVSADGLMLHRPRSDGAPGGGGGSDTEAERERELASSLEDRTRTMLERVIGPGHVDVRVGVTLDNAIRERTEEHYEPTKTALRSEQRSEERSTAQAATVAGVPGAQPPAGGEPGAPSNLPGNVGEPATSNNATGGFHTNWTRNWEVDRVTEKTSTPAGRIARLSVAVLVDGRYLGEKKEYAARDKAEMEKLNDLVKNAVGFSAERGDTVQVDSAEFARHDEPEAPPPEAPRINPTYVYSGSAGAGLLFLITAVLLLRRSKKRTEAQRQISLALAEQPVAGVLQAAEGGLGALPAALSGTAPVDPSVIRAQALEIATRDPATAAIILRGWLSAPSVTGQVRV